MGQIIIPPPPTTTYKRQVFLASGTFTLPKTAFNKFDAVLVSGGGGGARSGTSVSGQFGGSGMVAFFQDVFCTNETTLTITVGAGGAAQTVLATNGNNGNASTITGIAGNGVSTSISSGIATGGPRNNSSTNPTLSPQVGFQLGQNNRQDRSRNMAFGFGMGMTSFQSGTNQNNATYNRNIFGSANTISPYTCNNISPDMLKGGSGGPVPLLGSLLHASVGTSGTAGTLAGGPSTANTFFAGTGGGGNGTYAGGAGVGGGGGAGGASSVGGTISGSGGSGSANSGGGGGGSGRNSVTATNVGNGGSGGSGFVVIGYWG
jgi:hypothetical protein